MIDGLAWVCAGVSGGQFTDELHDMAKAVEYMAQGTAYLKSRGWVLTRADDVEPGMWLLSYKWTSNRSVTDPSEQEFAFLYNPATEDVRPVDTSAGLFCGL